MKKMISKYLRYFDIYIVYSYLFLLFELKIVKEFNYLKINKKNITG